MRYESGMGHERMMTEEKECSAGLEGQNMALTTKECSAMIGTAKLLANKIEAFIFGARPQENENKRSANCMEDELNLQRAELRGLVETLKFVAERLGIQD